MHQFFDNPNFRAGCDDGLVRRPASEDVKTCTTEQDVEDMHAYMIGYNIGCWLAIRQARPVAVPSQADLEAATEAARQRGSEALKSLVQNPRRHNCRLTHQQWKEFTVALASGTQLFRCQSDDGTVFQSSIKTVSHEADGIHVELNDRSRLKIVPPKSATIPLRIDGDAQDVLAAVCVNVQALCCVADEDDSGELVDEARDATFQKLMELATSKPRQFWSVLYDKLHRTGDNV